LVAFKVEFESFGVLCGPNGAGKSSVFDALRLIRNLGTGAGLLGGDRDQDIPYLEFTNWQKGTSQESTSQEFELGVTSQGHAFEYLIQIEQKADFEKPRFLKERAICDGRVLFERDMEGVSFRKGDGNQTGFPLDWRQSALGSHPTKGKYCRSCDFAGSRGQHLDPAPKPARHGRREQSGDEASGSVFHWPHVVVSLVVAGFGLDHCVTRLAEGGVAGSPISQAGGRGSKHRRYNCALTDRMEKGRAISSSSSFPTVRKP
jgi:energy-coupling factor transporter ATP-binding protein EcfA2